MAAFTFAYQNLSKIFYQPSNAHYSYLPRSHSISNCLIYCLLQRHS
uniref:Uncharacterized protein n=1 Tax=Arundo donax TaxID=35708 RepID=A0A0A8Z5G5_ARUDO